LPELSTPCCGKKEMSPVLVQTVSFVAAATGRGEDAVQEAWLRLSQCEANDIENLGAS